MILILNNKINEEMHVDNVSRNLDVYDPNVLFTVNVSCNNRTHATSIRRLADYENTTITAYKVIDANNQVLVNETDCEGKLTSYSENFTDDYYSLNATFQIKQEPAEAEE